MSAVAILFSKNIARRFKKTEKRGENLDRNARVKQDHLPFMSYVDTNLYEKLNNRNPLAYEIIHKKSQITYDKSQTILKSLISHASTHPIFAMTSSDDNRCKRL